MRLKNELKINLLKMKDILNKTDLINCDLINITVELFNLSETALNSAMFLDKLESRMMVVDEVNKILTDIIKNERRIEGIVVTDVYKNNQVNKRISYFNLKDNVDVDFIYDAENDIFLNVSYAEIKTLKSFIKYCK